MAIISIKKKEFRLFVVHFDAELPHCVLFSSSLAAKDVKKWGVNVVMLKKFTFQ